MFGLTPQAFGLFGIIYLFKAWGVKDRTKEHELLIDAIDLLSASDAT
jgi:hypothetical protein